MTDVCGSKQKDCNEKPKKAGAAYLIRHRGNNKEQPRDYFGLHSGKQTVNKRPSRIHLIGQQQDQEPRTLRRHRSTLAAPRGKPASVQGSNDVRERLVKSCPIGQAGAGRGCPHVC